MQQSDKARSKGENHFILRGSTYSRDWLSRFSWEGALGNGFIVLTGGAFLTSLALYFGAGDFEIGLLSAIPFLSQIAQLFSSPLINLIGNRKLLTILGFLFGRQIWLLSVPLLFVRGEWRLEAFLVLVVLSNLSTMLAIPGWLSWISDLVPARLRGRYFGRRNSAIAVSTVLATVAGGLILDHFKAAGHENLGFSAIIGIGCLAAIISIVILRKLPDRIDSVSHHHYSWNSMLEPIQDRRFRHLLIVFFVWNLALGVAAVFFAAHMLINLRMSFTYIALYICVVSLSAVLMNNPWGKLIDRFGSKPVLFICAMGIAFIPIIWFLPRADFLWILAIEALFSGAVWGGFNLAAFNIPIAHSPRENRPSFLALFSVVTGIGFFIAAIAGGILAESLTNFKYVIGKQTLVNYHVLFAISSLLRIVAALLFLTFHEPGEKRIPYIIQFMGYAVLKQLSVGRQIVTTKANGNHAHNDNNKSRADRR
jgi:MFS family permease